MINSKVVLASLDHRIRSSLAYTQWVEQNKSSQCLLCDSTENLQVHHITSLYQVIRGHWLVYKDEDEVFNHVCESHRSGSIEGISVCQKCHADLHTGRAKLHNDTPINTDMWCAIPRMLKVKPNHSRIKRDGEIGLISYQVLLAIGWYLLNGHIEMRMLPLNRRRLAQLLCKTPGVSFNKSFDEALEQLKSIGVVDDHWQEGNEFEIYISKMYLKKMEDNPWFVPLSDVHTSSMSVLCVRLFLGMQCFKRKYVIGLEKLKKHVGITDNRHSRVLNVLKKSVDQTNWLSMRCDKNLYFKISGRLPTPIRRLRVVLYDCLKQAK